MALVLIDRAQEDATANTTVSFTLLGAQTGYQTLAGVGNTNTTYYGATDGTNWEAGIGTYSTTGPTLTRTTILASSAGGTTAVTFSGAVTVFVDYPAERAVYENESGVITGYPISGGTINNTPIGATTANTGTFTTLNSGIAAHGGTASTSQQLLIGGSSQTANTTEYGVFNTQTVQSAVTNQYSGFSTFIGTQATAFTLAQLIGYQAGQGTIGSGSTVTSQIGFSANSGLTGATNNYAFSGGIASGTGRWNAYMGGTAANYFAGQVGINTTTLTNGYLSLAGTNSSAIAQVYIGGANTFAGSSATGLNISTQLTGTTATTVSQLLYVNGTINTVTGATLSSAYGIINTPSFSAVSGSTLTTAYANYSVPVLTTTVTPSIYGGNYSQLTLSSGATGGTISNGYNYFSASPTFSTATTGFSLMFGFYQQNIVGTATATIGTAYAFYANQAASNTGVTTNWNFYANGTAPNYFAGSLGIGTTAVGTTASSLVVKGLTATSAAAPTIASATTIAPTTQIVFISGTTPIATITAPSPISAGGGQITLIPTGIFTTTITGNIALASTAIVNKALIMTYDTTTAKWYPSY